VTLERFSWLIKDKLAGMAHPGEEPDAFQELKAAGVRAVVGLTMRPLPERMLRELGMTYLHLPIPNFAPPQPSQIDRFIEFCRRSNEEGRPVVVHCLGGCGRTGTMLACYLVWEGMAPQEAIRTVRAGRPCSIETPEQERAVFEFAAATTAARKDAAHRGCR